MKRLFAILLSLLFIWAEAIAMALPARAGTPAGGSYCSCKTAKCCVSKSDSSDSPTQPFAPTQSVQFNLNQFTLSVSPAWLLPLGETEAFSAASALRHSAARVPLFTRDCTLLI